MLKKLFVISCAALSISCASKPEEKPKTCPLVFTAESSYTQIVQHMDAYQVILTGYHGNCVDYSVTKSSTAVIQPTFLIRRLEAVGQVNVPFDYYVKTTYGSQKHHVIATIPEFEKEVRYLARPVNVTLPYKQRFETPISIGLVIEPEEQIYNNRYFDEKFDYSEEK